ncbi:MAG: DUF5674 family protein [Candidatus Xenobiia bacterium LiM19]
MDDYPIRIIRRKIKNRKLREFLDKPFTEMVKCVVDIERKVVALGGELHVDAEQLLLEDGSSQADIWGANIYPDAPPPDRIDCTALMNIRPSQNNRAMEIQDEAVRIRMKAVIKKLIEL